MSVQNLRKLDLNLLLILNTLIKEQHVSKTAQQLGLTQSAVSHALNRLRHHFDDPLFIREGHTMIPTVFSESLRHDLNIIIGQIERLGQENAPFKPKECQHTFTIGLPEYLAISFLNQLSGILSSKAPNIKIITQNTSFLTGQDALLANSVDLVIGRNTETAKSINQEFLCHETYICAIGKKNPLFGKKRITLKDYLNAQHMHISLKAKNKGYIDEHLKTLGHKRDIHTTISNYLLGLLMVEKNTLLLTEPRHTILSLEKKLQIQTFKTPFASPQIEISQFWHRKFDSDPAHIWLRSQIKSISKKL